MNAVVKMKTLVEQVKQAPFLDSISQQKLEQLVNNDSLYSAVSGDIVIDNDTQMKDHLILLDGKVELQRISPVQDANDKSHTKILNASNQKPKTIFSAMSNMRVRALTNIKYVLINADTIDELLGGSSDNSLMRCIATKHHLPKDIIDKIEHKVEYIKVEAGQIIINESDKADNYYLIDGGEAEIVRSDPFTGEKSVVGQIGVGDGFGEEALVQDGFRNATVRMLTPGKLMVLQGDVFKKHVQSVLCQEIEIEDAYEMLQKQSATLIDCRYDMEYDDCHIAGATLIPLHEFRERIGGLDRNAVHLIYCRSGRRSKAAAFLMQERNIQGISIKGGIKAWPYELVQG